MRTRLRNARRRAGMTQSDIALELNVSRSYYSQIECGVKNPSFRIALAIKMALHETEDSLFDNSEEPLMPGNPYIREFGRKTLAER
jgi:putative transcriptional regulator